MFQLEEPFNIGRNPKNRLYERTVYHSSHNVSCEKIKCAAFSYVYYLPYFIGYRQLCQILTT